MPDRVQGAPDGTIGPRPAPDQRVAGQVDDRLQRIQMPARYPGGHLAIGVHATPPAALGRPAGGRSSSREGKPQPEVWPRIAEDSSVMGMGRVEACRGASGPHRAVGAHMGPPIGHAPNCPVGPREHGFRSPGTRGWDLPWISPWGSPGRPREDAATLRRIGPVFHIAPTHHCWRSVIPSMRGPYLTMFKAAKSLVRGD